MEKLYSGPWRMGLTEQPDPLSCEMMARRYLRVAAPSIPEITLEHVAQTAASNLCSDPEEGQLEVISEEDENWVWPELEAHSLQYAQFNPCLDSRQLKFARDYLLEVEQKSIGTWLSEQPMATLRTWRKSQGLPTIKRKSDLVFSLLALPQMPQQIVDAFGRWKSERLLYAERSSANCNVIHVHRLVDLAMSRIRACVLVTLHWCRPASHGNRNEIENRRYASERYEKAKTIDLAADRSNLELGFIAQFGEHWAQRLATRQVFDFLVKNLERSKNATIDEIYQELSSVRYVYSLKLTRCAICEYIGKPEIIYDFDEKFLPPFHPSCSCSIEWQNEREGVDSAPMGPNFRRLFSSWAKENIRGLSVIPPTLKDLVAWREAQLLDESLASRDRDSIFDKFKKIWKK